MKVIFWLPRKSLNLVKLLFLFDKRPIVYWCSGFDMVSLTNYAEYLNLSFTDSAHRRYKKTYLPSFVTRKVMTQRGVGEDALIQPLDRKSLYFFLSYWDCQDELLVFSSDIDIDGVSNEIKKYVEHPEFNPSQVMKYAATSCRFALFPGDIFDINKGVVITSGDEKLLHEMFGYLTSVGERGFSVGDTSTEERDLKGMREAWDGMYMDDYENVVKWWMG